MRISMYVKFQILQNKNGNLIPLSKTETQGLCIGGYYFTINGMDVPFDWDAFSGGEKNNIYEFETGYGWFNDFELSDCYDGDYEELGITRENITAEFLASVERINEFHMDFEDEDGIIIDLGWNDDEEYKIVLLEIIFTDLNTGEEYNVKQKVLDEYNKGE